MFHSIISTEPIKVNNNESYSMKEQLIIIHIFDTYRFDFIYSFHNCVGIQMHHINHHVKFYFDDEEDLNNTLKQLENKKVIKIEKDWVYLTRRGNQVNLFLRNIIDKNHSQWRKENKIHIC